MAKSQTSQQQNQPTGPVEVLVSTNQLIGKAGEWIELPPVRINNDRKKGKSDFYGYSWRAVEGKIDKFGYHQLPIVYGQDKLVEVRCYSNYDPSQYKAVPILVEAIEVKLNPPLSAINMQSGQEICLLDIMSIENDIEKKGITFSSSYGEVKGPVFRAPIIYGGAKDFAIKAVSNADHAVSTLIPIHIEPVIIELQTPASLNLQSRQRIAITRLVQIYGDIENKGYSIVPSAGQVNENIYEAPEVWNTAKDFEITVFANAHPSVQKIIPVHIEPRKILLIPPVGTIDLQSKQRVPIADFVRIEGDITDQGFTLVPQEGEVKGNIYEAPEVRDYPHNFSITVFANAEPSVQVKISVEAAPQKVRLIVPLSMIELKSRQRIPIADFFKTENDPLNLGVTIFVPEGRIDGAEFEAPEAKGYDMVFLIRGTAKADPTVQENVQVVVQCAQIIINRARFNNVHVGQHQEFGIPLEIEIENDPDSRKNYSCELKKGLGKLDGAGVYTPPKFLTETKEVQILVSSNFDPAIKELFTFSVKPNLCDRCGRREINAMGFCPDCGRTKYSTASIEFKCKGCGQPLTPGETCKKCGYPKAKVLKFF